MKGWNNLTTSDQGFAVQETLLRHSLGKKILALTNQCQVCCKYRNKLNFWITSFPTSFPKPCLLISIYLFTVRSFVPQPKALTPVGCNGFLGPLKFSWPWNWESKLLKWVWLEGPGHQLSFAWCSFSAWMNNVSGRQCNAFTLLWAWHDCLVCLNVRKGSSKHSQQKNNLLPLTWGGNFFHTSRNFYPNKLEQLEDPFLLSPLYFILASSSLCCFFSYRTIDHIPLTQHMEGQN